MGVTKTVPEFKSRKLLSRERQRVRQRQRQRDRESGERQHIFQSTLFWRLQRILSIIKLSGWPFKRLCNLIGLNAQLNLVPLNMAAYGYWWNLINLIEVLCSFALGSQINRSLQNQIFCTAGNCSNWLRISASVCQQTEHPSLLVNASITCRFQFVTCGRLF